MSDRDGTPLEPGCTGPFREYCPIHPRHILARPDVIPPVVPAPSLEQVAEELWRMTDLVIYKRDEAPSPQEFLAILQRHFGDKEK